MSLSQTALYMAIPLFGTLLGMWASAMNGISPMAFLPNFMAILIGAIVIFYGGSIASAVNRDPKAKISEVVALLTSTLLFPGVDSVHRWIAIGQFNLHLSMVLSPIALLCFLRLQQVWLLGATGVICAIHLAQPDAGQATAFAMAASVIFLFREYLNTWVRTVGCACLALSAASSWTRFDPLPPVSQVEEIMRLISSLGWTAQLLGALAVLLAFVPLARAFRWSSYRSRCLSLSYAMLLFGSYLVTEIGNFPVPLIGAGAASILGWCFMVGLVRGAE